MIKQVIIVRKDLNMRKGKIGAQCAHASMGFLISKLDISIGLSTVDLTEIEEKWIKGNKKKIVLYAEDEQSVIHIYNKAKENGLTVYKVIDNGLTEFHNIPTLTCIAIGPNKSNEIDKITINLKLL